MSNFVHLHCHTEYSLLDGAIQLPDLVRKAKEFKMPAAAITDHGYMFGATHFYVQCKDNDITPIIGCEVYVAKDHLDRSSDIARVRHHLILLAQNNIGYKNLLKVVSKGCLEGMYYKPRVDMGILKEYNEGIIALSACIAGEIPRTLLNRNAFLPTGGNFDAAIEEVKKYQSIYGDRFYLEVQSNTLPEQDKLNTMLFELGEKCQVPVVATNDCHYLEADDVEAHDVLLCIQTQAKVQDAKRMHFEAKDLYYKSPDEMMSAFSSNPEVIENTLKITELCSHVSLDLKSNFFPVYDLPEGMTLEKEFRRLAQEGFEKRMAHHPKKDSLDIELYRNRLALELDVICQMGFPGYFLIVQDFINWAKDNGIPVGPGRGSAAGSLVAYALRITNLDPIPYHLLFERFLNSERISLPDIDVDFCEEKRVKVIRYVTEKYGVDKVAQITTFGKMKAKAVIKDVGRAMDVSYKETDQISKLIPFDPKMTIKKALEAEPELAELYKNEVHIRKMIDIAIRLEGLSRHASTHAAGVVVSDKPMVEYLPLYKGKKEELVTQYDMTMVEKVGLVKFDFLGLRTMTVIQNTLDNITAQGKQAPDLDTLLMDDPQVFELFSRGDTDGVFQLESSGMRQYLRLLKPTCFEDIIAMLALYRPGPLGSGMVDEFIKRKHGEVEVSYPLPSLEQCLKDTYGIIVYQEQVMQIAQIAAGYTLGGADLLRRAMGKKKAEVMAKERSTFIEGAKNNNVDLNIANEIFDLMEKFAEYGFNKSHSAAYALITYHVGYLKTYFKVEFMAALLTSEIGNQDKVLKYIASCRDMGIVVKQPSVQNSLREFSVEEGEIIYGLGGIKGVGDEGIKEIIRGRFDEETNTYKPFSSFFDFLCRVKKISKRIMENLIKCGACDCFGVSRASLLAVLDLAIAKAQKKAKDKNSQQVSLLSFAPQEKEEILSGIGFNCPESTIPEWEEEQKLNFEKEALGFFLTSHPLQAFRSDFSRLGIKELDEIADYDNKAEVRIPALITSIREFLTKKGDKMAFAHIEDLTGQADITFLPNVYAQFKEIIKSDQALEILATIDKRNEVISQNEENEEDDENIIKEIKLLAVSLRPLLEACQQSDLPVELFFPEKCMQNGGIEEFKALLMQYKGNKPVHLKVEVENNILTLSLGRAFTVQPSPQLFKAVENFNKKYCEEIG